MAYCADMLDYYAGLVVDGTEKAERRAPPPAAYELDAACSIATYPAGVAALVTPWNYPLLQAVLKVAPAVAAGCPFVLKPSPLASLTCVDFLQTILGPLTPPGACNLLTGGPPLSGSERGAGALLADPRVAVCSFTGSSRGGEAVLNAAAPFARPSALELGGKGALVVLDDADVEAAADQALVGILSCARRRPVLFTVLFTRESCIPWFFTVGERHRCAVYAMPSTRRRRGDTRGVE